MGRPTKEELDIAIAEAIRLKESGEDVHFLGKSLLNLNYRMRFLERVMDSTKRYLHAGLGGREHHDLLKAIEAAEKASGLDGDDHLII